MNDDIKLLVVDDEKEIVDLIDIYLSNEGYQVYKAYAPKDAIEIASQIDVKLVILDVMMPDISGLKVCSIIRKKKNIPIIMLSAKSEDIDKIMGLSTGADDYMVKPFNPLELIARVKSQLRRYLYLNPQQPNKESTDLINIDGLEINQHEHLVNLDGNEIILTPTEFEILYLLAVNRGRVFSSEEIFEKIWGQEYYESSNTVMVHIRKIREKIEEDSRKPKFIKTVWGVGYKIEK